MTLMRFSIALLASASVASTAFAGEMADACAAKLEAEGRDTSGCQSLEDAVIAGGLEEEFAMLGEIDDPAERYAAASDEAKEAMKCTRPDGVKRVLEKGK